MENLIIDGRFIAQKIEMQIKEEVAKLPKRVPALAFICVGENPASLSYIRMKKRKCSEVGIRSIDREFPATISQEKLIEEIQACNQNPSIDGILIQLPLPPHIQVQALLETLDPSKDVDGFHPLNVGRLLIGEQEGFIPCTPYGIVTLLSQTGINPTGKHVVILGRSMIVGKPLAALLMQKQEQRNATVTIAHSQTEKLPALCRTADILVAAMGVPHFVKPDMVQPGAVVIDVGINRIDKTIVGDVDFEKVAPLCSAITPVPGGVGPMTIAMLLSNTFLSFKRRMK